jgi:anaerobic magnesium-protoporphyrin IX monomethyl ester cyclase
MRILIINPPHLSIGSRIPNEHLPPLGLLSIAGPLIDARHEVKLLDADFESLKFDEIITRVGQYNPNAVLLGHSGSTSAQPIINDLTKQIRQINNKIKIIIGGVFPTYHWKEILENNSQIDFIVCGEGEEITSKLISALEQNKNFESIKGIAYNLNNVPFKTQDAHPIDNIDQYRIGWELIKEYNYTYWGNKKAVVIQFSRGCPYPCTYCGQSLFWKKWRHRNPQLLADEIETLHKEYGIEVINFADENPSSSQQVWKEFLEALIAKKIKIILVGSIRADNIVRDADFLHLYKKAGFERLLLGIESYDEAILGNIKKSGTTINDKEAIQLLRKHNILSMATYVIGFGEEKIRDFFYSLKQLLNYDPDQIQLLYATPHKWTPYYNDVKEKEIILTDQRKWDYKHQVISIQYLKPWVVILAVKFIEIIMQTRPKALIRLFFHRESRLRSAMRWYTKIGRRVWFYELFQFFILTRLSKDKIKMKDFWK